ncbi:SH3 domain-containing protein [Jatrophihabitans lederbergiae]|uniref:SH3 domain-containing protein n=1 Tax=Jatrophihabitans lederbergiae TaxID=3075547 RepID=A0ABU2JHB0_9ACTN|nr:hypothetical protein [Jatrophihabitans sp. DSM 44399]MDT0264103.1 hypothetical protein [Jatrophihabitans sp. DSM 44399]
MAGDATDEQPPPQLRPEDVDDPFIHLMNLLVELNGSRRFVRDDGRLVVSVRTVDRYRDGSYPKRYQDQVGDIDRWARARFPYQYPPHGWSGGLTYDFGRARQAPPPNAAADSEHSPASAEPVSPVDSETPSEPETAPEPEALAEPIDAAVELAAEPPIDDTHAAGAAPVQPAEPVSLPPDDTLPTPPGPVLEPDRRPWPLRRRYAAAVIVAAGGLVALTVALRPHHNSAPHDSTVYSRDDAAIAVRSCPEATCAPTETLQTGARVQMICYRDAERANLNYSSMRWFDVRDEANGITGWVHSSQVEEQTNVGLC